MSTNTTEIVFILDRSGSMDSIAESAIKGFNDLLERQKREHDETPVRMSLVLFNTEYEVPFLSISAPELEPLNMETYSPDGGTALLDAIGRTIDETGVRLAGMPESDRPGKVIIAILTDGEENSSRHYNWLQISDMIKHQRNVYQWDFLFLGANQDAIATASSIGIDVLSATCFEASAGGITQAMKVTEQNFFERKVRVYPNSDSELEW